MPSYEVSVDLDNVPKGQDVEVAGVGIIPNGDSKTVEVTADEAKHLGTGYGIKVSKAKGGDDK